MYCRVSDRKQKTNGGGLESQLHRCLEYALGKGLIVEEQFLDDVSGGGGNFDKRPALLFSITSEQTRKQTMLSYSIT